MPHEFFTHECSRLGIDLPHRGEYAVGMTFLPQETHQRERCETLIRQTVEAEGQTFLGWRDVPVNPDAIGTLASQVMPTIRQFFVGRSPRLQDEPAFERKLYVIRREIEKAIIGADMTDRNDFYICSLSCRTIVYKGLLIADQIGQFYHDLRARLDGVGLRAGALALQHQHARHLEAGAPLPLRRAQRRDQHAARQRQLDDGPPGAVLVAGDGRGREEDRARDRRRRAERHGELRQRARAAARHRPQPAALDAHADPRGVGRPHPDGRRQEGVLRVPRLHDGAMGRPRADHRHGRHSGLRHPRPQRPAPLPLLGHDGRPADPGFGDGCARHPAGEGALQAPHPAGPHVPARHQGRPPDRGRGDQGRAGQQAALRPVAQGQHGVTWTSCRSPRATTASKTRTRCCCSAARLRLHAGRHRHNAGADGDDRRRAGGLDGQRHPARGAVRPEPAALPVLPPAVRAGVEPAAGRLPRRDRHVAGELHRPGEQPVRRDAGARQAAQAQGSRS